MSEQKSEQRPEGPRRAPYVPVFGLLLLFLGIVFLLQSLGVIPWGLWHILWRLWPVLIITAGLSILLRRLNPWFASLLILIILFACLGIAIGQYNPSAPKEAAPTIYTEALGNMERAQIKLNFNAGSLVVGSLPADSTNLVEVGSKAMYGDATVKTDFQRSDTEGKLYLKGDGNANTKWEVKLNRNIPLTMDFTASVSDTKLDLNNLRVNDLSMKVDAGNYQVIMPASTGDINGYIKADLANLEVTLPTDAAARLKIQGDLGVVEIDESRFPLQGNYYMSRDFELAQNKIDLKIDCDMGRVQVK
jgi:hypothetical protein